MGGSFSDYLEDKLIDHVQKIAAFTQPTNLYLALYTVAPDDSGGGTEVSGNGYVRKLAEDWLTSSGGATYNTADIAFAAASGGNWGTIVAFAQFDAISGGNMLLWGDLDVARVINDGDVLEFLIGELDISLD